MKADVNSGLAGELFIIALLGVVALAALFIPLGSAAGTIVAIQGLLQSIPLWAALWLLCWFRRGRNRTTPESAPLPTLGAANRLSLLRALLIAACAGFLWQPVPLAWVSYVPALCYSLAALLDRIDGYFARRHNQTTLLGSSLDTHYDAIGLVIAPLLAVQYGKLPPAYLLVSAAYYLFIAGLWWRHRLQLPVAPLRQSVLRRTLAGTQMGFVAVALWPPLQDILTRLTAIAFMVPLLIGFWVDWLIVSCRLPLNATTEQEFARVADVSARLLLPLLRLLLALALWLSIVPLLAALPQTQQLLVIAAALSMLLGIAARIGAIVLLLAMNWLTGIDFIDPATIAVQFFAVWLLLFGSGAFSLWQGDGDWINRQDGA